jgi:hypothetical protein
VTPAMAETTTATSFPASTSRLTRVATLRMQSRSATEVPPNFITMRDIGASCQWSVADGRLPVVILARDSRGNYVRQDSFA